MVSGVFREQLEPFRDALDQMIDASDELGRLWGWHPAADSPAMRERSEEGQYVGAWGKEPVLDAHTQATLLVVLAQDNARSLCRLLLSGPVPIWSHVVLGRATLEAAGRVAWMTEVGIGTRRRVARGMTERIYSYTQAGALPRLQSTAFTARRQAILDEADRQGFTRRSRKGSPPALEEERPSNRAVVRLVLDDGDLGAAVYGFFSAVAHGTHYGLLASVSPHEPDPVVGLRGAIGTSSLGVATTCTSVALGFGRGFEAYRQLYGWSSDRWTDAHHAGVGDLPKRLQETR